MTNSVEQVQALLNEVNQESEAISKKYMDRLSEVICQEISETRFSKIVVLAYTPYFNDGEECVFSIHGVHGFLKDSDVSNDVIQGRPYELDSLGSVDLRYSYSFVTQEFRSTPEELDLAATIEDLVYMSSDYFPEGIVIFENGTYQHFELDHD